MILLVVFLPLIGFLFCSLSIKYISDRSAQLFTTILLFISALFSWIIFIDYLFGEETKIIYLISFLEGNKDDPKGIELSKKLFETSPVFNVAAMSICIITAFLYAFLW